MRISRARTGIFHALDQDVRYAIRTFSSGKSFALAVIGSLAIGIGATATAFALVNATLFRPLPEIRGEEQLVRVTIGPRGRVWIATAWDDYQVLRNGIPALADLSVAHDTTFAVTTYGGVEPRTVGGLVVSGNYFDVLGVRPALGRFFVAEEDAVAWARPAVVISHRFWQLHLSSDPAVLGRTLTVNGAALPIIGVAPEGFTALFTRGDAQLWTTFALSDLVFRDGKGGPIQARDAAPFHTSLIGRLHSTATIEQAGAQAAGLAQPLAAARERGLKELFVKVEPLRMVDPVTYAPLALGLMAVPLIVLAIACVNAANLLLARATRRRADWAVRLALGASRWRLIRQMLVESLLLALAGGAAGLVLSYWSRGFLQNQTVVDVPIDGNVMLFVVGAAVATAIAFGLGPALSVTRAAMSRAPAGGRGLRGPFGSRTRSALVVIQAALCLGLLATGAQFANTLRTLWDDGLPEAGQFLSVSLDVDPLRYGPAEAEAFYSQLLDRVRELPAVRAAALTDGSARLMLSGIVMDWGARATVPGGPDASKRLVTTYATADFFKAMGLPILQGRTFSAEEHRRPARSVVVNQAFARQAFGGDALGRVLTITERTEADNPVVAEAVTVGVIAAPLERPYFGLPMVFYPAPLAHEPERDLLVRFDGNAETVATAVRTIVSGIDSRLPVGLVATGEEHRRLRNIRDYTLAQTVSVLGVLSLILAAGGLYGVVSYMVMLRQKEIGIRMALGAARGSVLRLILRQSIGPVLLGCGLGAGGAVVVGALVRSRLYGVARMDPAAFGGAALLLLATMLAASVVPARRAARVDPIEVLRTE